MKQKEEKISDESAILLCQTMQFLHILNTFLSLGVIRSTFFEFFYNRVRQKSTLSILFFEVIVQPLKNIFMFF